MNKKRIIDGVEVEIGSGNVYADLGYPNPEEMLLKSELAYAIKEEFYRLNITQAEAGKIMGVDQADVSRLLKGSLRTFSVVRLLLLLNKLGYSVEMRLIRESEKSRKQREPHTYVNLAA